MEIYKKFQWTVREKILSALVLLACMAAVFLPMMAQDQSYHQFADQRFFWGIPNTFDSLSNLAFLGLGLWGLVLQKRGRLVFERRAMCVLATLFFIGFITTGLGSLWYHLAPNDGRLVWDRMGMVVAFSGLIGMVAAHKVSPRAGYILAIIFLVAGPLSVGWWAHSGNLAPYLVVQFGGIALIIWMMLLKTTLQGPNWVLFIALYIFAKLLEMWDRSIFEVTHMLISGHTLKHIVAASAALAILAPTVWGSTRNRAEKGLM